LFTAVRYTDTDLQMPPDGKLSQRDIDVLKKWIADGAFDPRVTEPDRIADGGTRESSTTELWSLRPVRRVHQGVRVYGEVATINDLQPSASNAVQRQKLALLRRLNEQQLTGVGSEAGGLDARIKTFELAFRMQREAPEALDLDAESQQTHALYGTNDERTSAFGHQCLFARRLVERGVRFIQCPHREGESITWDDHSNLLKHHPQLAEAVDKPIAGLLTDLQQRGLLEDTLVMWGGEFGRTPTAEGNDGRDHNPHGFTWWLAGGGLKPGFHFGATDEYGYYAIQDRVHVHDLHATLLHLMGLDHEQLTYRHSGRDFRLADVHGRVVREILS
jgi:hypothetical protein